MQLEIDENVKRVLVFMRESIPASKLISVAESLPELARLLWRDCPQESFVAHSLIGVDS